MAGIEQLEIHSKVRSCSRFRRAPSRRRKSLHVSASKSYIVRWVKVDGGHTVSWSVQPHKKSM